MLCMFLLSCTKVFQFFFYLFNCRIIQSDEAKTVFAKYEEMIDLLGKYVSYICQCPFGMIVILIVLFSSFMNIHLLIVLFTVGFI